ncbi:VF530 family DNA-binding protein [Arcobacter sp.]|uniref:VF530 family protein n=1 Tax=Arcobacter sp. TaxID=1872629 RepID=UPI003C764558
MATTSENRNENTNNPLHGVKLQDILEYLVKSFGFKGLGNRINIKCFLVDPSINSSLKFLRKTPWARTKVEELYLKTKAKENEDD